MAVALVVFENERNIHQRVFQPRLENLDDLRDFEVKNRYRLPSNLIEELHSLIEAEITAQRDRSNPVLMQKLIRNYVDN